jgi:hypothetical protein
MSLEKFKLFYSSTVGEDDEVKSFLFASDGTALTHTAGALDVNIASSDISIQVLESDVHAEDAAHTSGDEGSFMLAVRRDTPTSGTSADGDYASLNVDASGQLYVVDDAVLTQLQTGVTVSATDLDIRDLVFATDSVDVSGSSVSITGDVNVTQGTSPWVVSATDLDIRDLAFATDSVDVSGSSVSITGSVTVTATDLDIRDLNHATDSVTSRLQDGSGNAIESIGGNLSVADCVQFGSVSAPSLGTANTAATVTALSSQKKLEIQNLSNFDLYYGPVGTTTVANGLMIPKKSIKEVDVSGSIDLICASVVPAGDVRVGAFIAS